MPAGSRDRGQLDLGVRTASRLRLLRASTSVRRSPRRDALPNPQPRQATPSTPLQPPERPLSGPLPDTTSVPALFGPQTTTRYLFSYRTCGSAHCARYHPYMGMKATTVRFGEDLWAMLDRESTRLGVSAAQFIREATIM